MSQNVELGLLSPKRTGESIVDASDSLLPAFAPTIRDGQEPAAQIAELAHESRLPVVQTFHQPEAPPERYEFWHRGPAAPVVASGIVCGLQNIALSFALTSMVYQKLPQYVMVGFDCQNLAIMMACVAFSFSSTCPSLMGSPNAPFAVIFAGVVGTMSVELGADSEFIMPTVIMFSGITTFLTGCIFYTIGHLRLSKICSIIPQPVMSGFLASIGMKLAQESVKLGGGKDVRLDGFIWPCSQVLRQGQFWAYYWPVLPLALALFVLQRMKLIQPSVLWAVFLLVPLFLFYSVMMCYPNGAFNVSENFTSLQNDGWFNPPMESTPFYQMWLYGYRLQDVQWGQVAQGLMKVVWLIPIPMLSVFVGISATRKAGGLEPELDGDASTTGVLLMLQSLLCVPLTSNAGQLSVLNVSIAGATSRVPCLILLGIFIILFFLLRSMVLYIPRFYLAYLLLYNAFGFLVKNLVDSRYQFSKLEYAVPWVMVISDMLFHWVPFPLVAPLLVGFMTSTVLFAVEYSMQSVVKAVLCGQEARTVTTPHIRMPMHETLLRHEAGRLIVVQLQHYLFFGCVLQIDAVVDDVLAKVSLAETCAEEHANMRPRWIILDWEFVRGIDATLAGTFAVVVKKFLQAGLEVVFTGMDDLSVTPKLRTEGALKQVANTYETLHEGLSALENQLLDYNMKARARLINAAGDIAIANHRYMASQYREHVLAYQLGGNATQIWRYARRRTVYERYPICIAGDTCNSFFMVQNGTVEKRDYHGHLVAVLHKGACFNELALLFDSGAAANTVLVASGVADVLEINAASIREMKEQGPELLRLLERLAFLQSLAFSSTPQPGGSRNQRRSTASALGDAALRTSVEKSWNLPSQASESEVRECFQKLRNEQGVLLAAEVSLALLALGMQAPPTAVGDVDEEEFVSLARTRDSNLSMPLKSVFMEMAPAGILTADTLQAASPDLSQTQAEQTIIDLDLKGKGYVVQVSGRRAVIQGRGHQRCR